MKHNKHDVSEIDDGVRDCRIRSKKYYSMCRERCAKYKELSELTNVRIKWFTHSIDRAERQIIARSAQIKQPVGRQAQDLLEKLNSRKSRVFFLTQFLCQAICTQRTPKGLEGNRRLNEHGIYIRFETFQCFERRNRQTYGDVGKLHEPVPGFHLGRRCFDDDSILWRDGNHAWRNGS